MNCSKTDIHYRNGNKTRCFKTISHNTKHDQKKRFRQKEKRKNYFVNYYEIKEGIVDCSSEYITTSDTDDDGKTYNSSFDCKVEIIGLYKDLYIYDTNIIEYEAALTEFVKVVNGNVIQTALKNTIKGVS